MAEQNPITSSQRARLTCEQVTNLIRDYLNKELSPDLVETFENHLRRCADCEAFLNTYRRTVQEVQALSYEDIPQEMQKRVRQFLRAKMTKSPPSH